MGLRRLWSAVPWIRVRRVERHVGPVDQRPAWLGRRVGRPGSLYSQNSWEWLVSDSVPAGAQSFEEPLERNGPDFEGVDIAASDASTIGYTSGTTGHPKGAMATHRAVLLNSAMIANIHVRTAADPIVTALP
ncbi:MAG: AMP-binding protein, partial [Rubrobacter sp.]|nr:AMP-binding protein [Rubrobacter sp.]